MMAALLVALAATAVFSGIDGANALSGASKSRAIGASIAEDDQERLRALPPADLVDRTEAAHVVQRGDVQFTVQSSSKWIADRDATPDCSSVTSRAGYLRIRSEVSWPDMRGSKPIVASSLVAPPNGTVTTTHGAFGIKVLNESEAGVAGVAVAVSGGVTPASKVTDVNGCAYWDDVPQGSYTYTAQKTGYVDYEGDESVTRTIGVSGGQTRFDSAYLDTARTMNVKVVTKRYGGSETAAVLDADGKAPSPDLPLVADLTNSKMAGLNGIREFGPATTASTRQLTGLYPLTYGAFVGACPLANNPSTYGVAAAGTLPYADPVKVWMPSINLRARINGAYVNGYTARFKLVPAAGSPCTTTYYRTTENVPGVGDGAIKYPEMPYGRYALCAEAYYDNAWWKAETTINNTNADGVNVTVDESMATQGRCAA